MKTLKTEMHSMGREAAIEFAKTGWWRDKSPREICDVQLFTSECCMSFHDFHKAMEAALGRPVFTHEFAVDYDGLVAEYLGKRETPSPARSIALFQRSFPSGTVVIV